MTTSDVTPSAEPATAWRDDAGIVLLGLCPLLAVTTTLINGLALGFATTCVLLVSNLAVCGLRPLLVERLRLLFFVLLITAAVTVVDRYLANQFFRLHLALGLFVPLIASNCLLLARADLLASRQGPLSALRDAAYTGAAFTVALTIVGALREAIGAGTLLADAEFLFGAGASEWTLHLGDGFLLAALPPGAFITVALVIAAARAVRLRT